MWRSKSFSKKTRKGKVLTVVKEHYLRDDIGCGSDVCTLCPADGLARLSNAPHQTQYLVLDTNVVLNQIDLLEKDCAPLCDIIIPQVGGALDLL
jgi:exosome complex exonuclease DIS3/RRP44